MVRLSVPSRFTPPFRILTARVTNVTQDRRNFLLKAIAYLRIFRKIRDNETSSR